MESDLLKKMLRDILLARAFEERAAQEYTQGNIAGFLHLYPGEEAVAVGVLHAAEPADYIVTTYREHVHALVRGIPANVVMAELFGKKTGCSGGMGGSNFDQSYLMGNSLNYARSVTLPYYTYQMGLTKFRFSYATAIGLFQSAISLCLVLGSNYASKKLTGSSFF